MLKCQKILWAGKNWCSAEVEHVFYNLGPWTLWQFWTVRCQWDSVWSWEIILVHRIMSVLSYEVKMKSFKQDLFWSVSTSAFFRERTQLFLGLSDFVLYRELIKPITTNQHNWSPHPIMERGTYNQDDTKNEIISSKVFTGGGRMAVLNEWSGRSVTVSIISICVGGLFEVITFLPRTL